MKLGAGRGEGNGNGPEQQAPVVLEVVAGRLAETVLSRVVGILASRAGLGVDRVTEALALADVLSAHSDEIALDGRVRMEAEAGAGGLLLRVGPVPDGAAQRLLDRHTDPELGNVIDRLADEVSLGQDGGETLQIRIAAAG